MYEKLKKEVYDSNIELHKQNLIFCSWGNVSGIDRKERIVVIKPSGVSYDDLTVEKMVAVDIDGNKIEGELNPSTDTPTHLELYRDFETIGGVCHTHSPYATMWAQACTEIPCYGTTGADYFYGPVPVTRQMTDKEIERNYELNTGRVITRCIGGMDPLEMPAVLVANHGPFTWGKTAAESVEAAVVLEQIAKMALGTIMINPKQSPISNALLKKHYFRKHGEGAYYGQK